jgi:S-adenosylmethionine decarboxylase
MRTKTRRIGVSTRRNAGERQVANYALARHVTVELYECDPAKLANGGELVQLLAHAAQVGGARGIDSSLQGFDGQANSGVVTFGESHLAVHAWPQHAYAAADLFMSDPAFGMDEAVEALTTGLGAGTAMRSADLSRGVPWQDHASAAPSTNGAPLPQRFAWSWEEKYAEAQAWGLSASVDIYDCEPSAIRDAENIREFVRQLCDRLGMKRFGECQVVNFGAEERVAGFSMTQLIETSLVSGHFANASNSAYLDIFSCKFYEPRVMAEFATTYFRGSRYRMQVSLRR